MSQCIFSLTFSDAKSTWSGKMSSNRDISTAMISHANQPNYRHFGLELPASGKRVACRDEGATRFCKMLVSGTSSYAPSKSVRKYDEEAEDYANDLQMSSVIFQLNHRKQSYDTCESKHAAEGEKVIGPGGEPLPDLPVRCVIRSTTR
jgi:hypothetical protein